MTKNKPLIRRSDLVTWIDDELHQAFNQCGLAAAGHILETRDDLAVEGRRISQESHLVYFVLCPGERPFRDRDPKSVYQACNYDCEHTASGRLTLIIPTPYQDEIYIKDISSKGHYDHGKLTVKLGSPDFGARVIGSYLARVFQLQMIKSISEMCNELAKHLTKKCTARTIDMEIVGAIVNQMVTIEDFYDPPRNNFFELIERIAAAKRQFGLRI